MRIGIWMVASVLGGTGLIGGPRPAAKLSLEVVGADSTAFDVTSTLIVGPTELVVWDAQYHASDARRLADRIAATGKRLKAIVISHPDHDHYMGAAILVERFPGTPVYFTKASLEEYQKTAKQQLEQEKRRPRADVADSVVTGQELPSNRLTVDGEVLEVLPDLQGDVLRPTNSVLWIPSLKAVLAADVVFDGVHPWLGASNEASRAGWRQAVKKLGDLRPTIVVAGHKKDPTSPDTPAALGLMDRYLLDFEALRKASANADQFFASLAAKYPDRAVLGLAKYSTWVAFKPPASS